MLTWVSGLYNGHHIQYHLYTVVCLSLPPPTNGEISYSDMTLGLNTVATYTCETGYTLTVGTTRVCMSGGNWTGSPPTCQGELCNSCIQFVFMSIQDCVHQISGCEVNVVMLRITHMHTYYTEGTGPTDLPSTDHLFTEPPPIEPPTTCPDLTVPANGMIGYNNMGTASPRPMDIVATFTCDTGYTLKGGTTRTCRSDGMWSGSAPTCQCKLVQ